MCIRDRYHGVGITCICMTEATEVLCTTTCTHIHVTHSPLEGGFFSSRSESNFLSSELLVSLPSRTSAWRLSDSNTYSTEYKYTRVSDWAHPQATTYQLWDSHMSYTLFVEQSSMFHTIRQSRKFNGTLCTLYPTCTYKCSCICRLYRYLKTTPVPIFT